MICQSGRGPQVLGDFGMLYHDGTLSKQEKGEENLLEAQGIL